MLFQRIGFLLSSKLVRHYYFMTKLLGLKKTGNEKFNVSMACFDGAQVFEWLGSYILSKLNVVVKREDVGIYRDDDLGFFRNVFGPQVDKKRK